MFIGLVVNVCGYLTSIYTIKEGNIFLLCQVANIAESDSAGYLRIWFHIVKPNKHANEKDVVKTNWHPYEILNQTNCLTTRGDRLAKQCDTCILLDSWQVNSPLKGFGDLKHSHMIYYAVRYTETRPFLPVRNPTSVRGVVSAIAYLLFRN